MPGAAALSSLVGVWVSQKGVYEITDKLEFRKDTGDSAVICGTLLESDDGWWEAEVRSVVGKGVLQEIHVTRGSLLVAEEGGLPGEDAGQASAGDIIWSASSDPGGSDVVLHFLLGNGRRSVRARASGELQPRPGQRPGWTWTCEDVTEEVVEQEAPSRLRSALEEYWEHASRLYVQHNPQKLRDIEALLTRWLVDVEENIGAPGVQAIKEWDYVTYLGGLARVVSVGQVSFGSSLQILREDEETKGWGSPCWVPMSSCCASRCPCGELMAEAPCDDFTCAKCSSKVPRGKAFLCRSLVCLRQYGLCAPCATCKPGAPAASAGSGRFWAASADSGASSSGATGSRGGLAGPTQAGSSGVAAASSVFDFSWPADTKSGASAGGSHISVAATSSGSKASITASDLFGSVVASSCVASSGSGLLGAAGERAEDRLPGAAVASSEGRGHAKGQCEFALLFDSEEVANAFAEDLALTRQNILGRFRIRLSQDPRDREAIEHLRGLTGSTTLSDRGYAEAVAVSKVRMLGDPPWGEIAPVLAIRDSLSQALCMGSLDYVEARMSTGIDLTESQFQQYEGKINRVEEALATDNLPLIDELLRDGAVLPQRHMERVVALRDFRGDVPSLVAVQHRLASVVAERRRAVRLPREIDRLAALLRRDSGAGAEQVLPPAPLACPALLEAPLARAASAVSASRQELDARQAGVRHGAGDLARQELRDACRVSHRQRLLATCGELFGAAGALVPQLSDVELEFSADVASAAVELREGICNLSSVAAQLRGCLEDATARAASLGNFQDDPPSSGEDESGPTQAALKALSSWEHLRQGSDAIAVTDSAVRAARLAVSEAALLPEAPTASTNDLAAKLRGAACAIRSEEDFWALIPRRLLRCSRKLLAAGRAELSCIDTQVEILSRMCEDISKYVDELKGTEWALQKATSRDPLVQDFDEKQAARMDAREAFEDAARALQRAQKRGKDTQAFRADVDAASAAARAADRALQGAKAGLVRVLHDFPEVAARLKQDLPSDLLALWVPERTLDVFSSQELLPISSQRRVYRVVDELGQAFVVKEYTITPVMLGVCYREATLLRRMRHPHIVELTAIFEDPSTGALYLQMPFYAQGQLDAWVQREKPDDLSVRRVLWQAAQALAHLHAHGVVHSDVKPANILVDGCGRARLADFDVSVDASTRVSSTHCSTRVGFSTGFASPDLLSTGASPATDVFAFGEVVRLVTKQCPEQEALVQQLKAADPASRPTVAQMLQHPFFDAIWAWGKDETRQCCVMASESCDFGNAACRLSEGVECAGQRSHFICHGCFDKHVQALAEAPISARRSREGRIFCPKHPLECDGCHFADADVAASVPTATFDLYIQARVALLEERKATELEAEMKQQLATELDRMAALQEGQRRVLQARRHIEEDILTCKCPRCGQAFVDFEGCFALRCSRCPCAFCAWCGADCGHDAHQHVPQCRERPRGGDPFYDTLARFQDAQARRRRRLLATYLPTLDDETRRAVCRALQPQLEGLV